LFRLLVLARFCKERESKGERGSGQRQADLLHTFGFRLCVRSPLHPCTALPLNVFLEKSPSSLPLSPLPVKWGEKQKVSLVETLPVVETPLFFPSVTALARAERRTGAGLSFRGHGQQKPMQTLAACLPPETGCIHADGSSGH